MSDGVVGKWVAIVGAIVGVATIGWTVYKDIRPTPPAPPAIVVLPNPTPEPVPAPAPPTPKSHDLQGQGKADARVLIPAGLWDARINATGTSSASPGGWMRLGVAIDDKECNFSKVYRNPSDQSDALEAMVECAIRIKVGTEDRVVEATAPNANADAKSVSVRVRLVEVFDDPS
jgi:hypothetical protein